jgi:glycosyltransferase involved in cell wall biosynthesis
MENQLKILMVDKFFFVKGGSERYFFELKKILEENGHTVIPFSMKHSANVETPFSDYFVENVDFNPSSLPQKLSVGMRSLGRIFYSIQAAERLKQLIRNTRPDIAHLHMIDHQLSPSILPVLKAANIPMVQTIHTFKTVCPSYRLYHMGKQKICEKCLHGSYYRALFECCHKNSFFATLLVVLETSFHKALQLYERNIDLFLVPSRFMGNKMIEAGVPPEKIRHLFYTIQIDQYHPNYDSKDYFLFFGRLSEEKGLLTLLKAVEGGIGLPLYIVGDGPQRTVLEAYVRLKGMADSVSFLGPLEGDALKMTVSKSKFVVVPSEWYENSPLVIYESFAMGKPVVGARIGGIPEFIEPGVNGFLFEAGNSDELRRWIVHLAQRKRALPKMGKAARRKAERLFSPQVHYTELMRLYQQLLNR